MSKTYANRSNARRAAKAAGLDLDTLTFVQESQGPCGWYWITNEPEGKVVAELADGSKLVSYSDVWSDPEPATPKAPRYRLVRRARKAAVAAAAPAPAPAQPATGTEPATLGAKKHKDFQLYGRSSAISPVKAVHDWLNANGQGISRKEALFQLAQLGINYATARTQYQKWFSANK